jgi:hypothetical protein
MEIQEAENKLNQINVLLKEQFILNEEKTYYDYTIEEGIIFSLPNVSLENKEISVKNTELILDICQEYTIAVAKGGFGWKNDFRNYIFETSGFIFLCQFRKGNIQKELINQKGSTFCKYKEHIFDAIQEYLVFVICQRQEQKKK